MDPKQALFRLRNRVFGINELDARASARHGDQNAVVARLETRVGELNDRLAGLHEQFEQTERRLGETRDQLGQLREQLTQLRSDYLPSQVWESFDVSLLARYEAGFTSAALFNAELQDKPVFADDLALLSHCARLIAEDDLVLEFGSWSGRTINHLAGELPRHRLFGFDSFEGLPEDWRSDFPKGAFRRDGLPDVPGNVELVVGWFDQTLPPFLDQHPGPIGLVHIDCDLYSSTKTVLEALEPRLREGTVLVFDEFFNYPGWQRHEYRAFVEFVDGHHWGYRYVGCNPHHQQVAVVLTSKTEPKVA